VTAENVNRSIIRSFKRLIAHKLLYRTY